MATGASVRPPADGMLRAVCGSLAVHLALFGLIWLVGVLRPHFVRAPQRVLTTKLVRLGTPRPEALLPRQEPDLPPPTTPPPPSATPPPPPATAPTPAPPQAALKPALSLRPEAVAAPSARARAAAMGKVSSALDRLRQKVEGTADGARDGEVSRAELQLMGDRYATEVERCIQRNYVIEGTDPSRVAALQATVVIRIQPNGAFAGVRVESGSGVPAFDRAVERAVHRCGRVSPPPPELRRQVRQDGLEIVFHP